MLLIAPPETFCLKTGTFFGFFVFGSIGPSTHLMRPVAGSCSKMLDAAVRMAEMLSLKNLSTGLPGATSATITSFLAGTIVESFIEWTCFAISWSGWFLLPPMS